LQPVSFRPRSSPWFTTAGWVVLAGVGAARWDVDGTVAVLRSLPWLAGLGYLAWLLFWRPRVNVRVDAVEVVNPLRTIVVPWAALIDVSTKFSLTLVTPKGTFSAWAAPGPGRHSTLHATPPELKGVPRSAFDAAGSIQIGDLPISSSGAAGDLVRRHWQELIESEELELGAADTTPVDVRWDRTALGVLAACLALGLLALI
jgi:hypothetical protein